MLSINKVYVVERHDPILAETSIIGAWSSRTYAWEHIVEALHDEKTRLEAEDDRIFIPEMGSERFAIIESNTVESKQKYYCLVDNSTGHEFLGFYITETIVYI